MVEGTQKRTALKVQCGSCTVVVNVPLDLVEHLLTVGQFTCPKCHQLQAINMAADAKRDIWKKVRSLNGSQGAQARDADPWGKGGAQAARDNGSKPAPSRGGADADGSAKPGGLTGRQFDAMFQAMVEDADEEAEDEDNGATFATYRPRKVGYGRNHPDPIVESASMAAVDPPDAHYQPALLAPPEDGQPSLSDRGLLSCVQLEAIVYACQRHNCILPDGNRAGFFIGDGAGVGKGRTLAGLVLENWLLGRRKHIWLSVATDLKLDAERDLADIGASNIPVALLNKMPYGRPDLMLKNFPEGVMFLTYSSLIASSDGGQSRLDQLLQWCGENFDGLIMYDECHKAKNLMPEQGSNPTRTGLKALELQERLPAARVVYCSATGASSARNMAYMVRLGLWGPELPFADFPEYLAAVQSRGLGTLQIVAMEMKARGMYVSRMLSFEGAEFGLVKVPLAPDMFKMYLDACRVWSSVRLGFIRALELLTTAGEVPSKALWRQFWATHQRFFRYMCLAAKVPRVVALTKEGLAEGKSVIIGLQSTGEARTSDVVAEKGSMLDDFVSGPRELLIRLVEDWFPLPGGSKAQRRALAKRQDDGLSASDRKGSDAQPSSSAARKRKSCSAKPSKLGAPPCRKRSATALARSASAKETSPSSLADDDAAAPEAARTPRNGTPLALDDAASAQPNGINGAALPSMRRLSLLAGGARTPETASPAPQACMRGGARKTMSLGNCASMGTRNSGGSGASPEAIGSPDPSPEAFGDALSEPDVEVVDVSSDDNRPAADDDDGGVAASAKASSSTCSPETADALQTLRQELLRMINETSFPTNPLDAVIDELGGPEQVAEMTGRKARLVRKGKSVIYENRNATGAAGATLELINIAEKQYFLDGAKRIAIISEAASAGISLHAERRQKNQQRRLHITMEMPWSAERAVQQFGRSHRANQSSAPQYRLMFTELGGEMRFAAAVARRLLNMGALTQGDRRARNIGLGSGDLNYDSPWGRSALQSMTQILLEERQCMLPQNEILACQPNDTGLHFPNSFAFFQRARVELLDAGVFRPRHEIPAAALGEVIRSRECRVEDVQIEDSFRSDVPRFLNRLLGIEPTMQRHIFDFYQAITDRMVQFMKQDGTYDNGIVAIQATSITPAMPPEVLYEDPESGASTLHHVLRVDRGMSYDHAVQTLRDHLAAEGAAPPAPSAQDATPSEQEGKPSPQGDTPSVSGFWMSGTSDRNKSVLLALESPGSLTSSVRIFRPKIGASCRAMKVSELTTKMKPCRDESSVKAQWDRLYQSANKVGSARIKHVSLITGSILPFWKHLEINLRFCRVKSDRRLKVVKVATAETPPQHLAGVVLPDSISAQVITDIRAAAKTHPSAGARPEGLQSPE